MKTAKFNIGLGRGEGEVVRMPIPPHGKTIIVKMRRGGKTKLIKRHIEKHRVVIEDDEPVCDSCKCKGVLDEFGECEGCLRDWNIRFENQGLG